MTANGSLVSDGESLQGSQVVRVYLRDGVTPSYSLWFEGVQYTPLYHGEDYDEFIIGDNGEVTILDGGLPYVSFSVGGVEVPYFVPVEYAMGQAVEKTSSWGSTINQFYLVGNCLNYPYRKNDDYPYFKLIINKPWNQQMFSALEFFNCVGENLTITSAGYANIVTSVIDESSPAYIAYQGFIIAVFNYTN